MATGYSPGAAPRLRFDKVALRLVQGVRGALEGAVPDGLCVVFALTAPIREPSKTLTALIETIRARLSLGAVLGEHVEALHGNEVRVRVVTSRLPQAVRVAGFVHNPDPPPSVLLDMAQPMLECVRRQTWPGAPAQPRTWSCCDVSASRYSTQMAARRSAPTSASSKCGQLATDATHCRRQRANAPGK